MFKKISLVVLGLSFGGLYFCLSYAETTTTVEQNTTQTTVTPSVSAKTKNSKKASVAEPIITTTSNTSVTTTKEIPQPRKVLDEETLKKISATLCTQGFKAYVGTQKKNVCQSQARSPDLAYSCVWGKKGKAAYDPNLGGLCNLDFTEHHGSISISKENFPSHPPLSYGTEAECCFRAAQDPVAN